jgi:hypothetical protein
MLKSLNSRYEKRFPLVAFLLLWVLFQCILAEATTVEKLSLEEMTRRSRRIVVGRCISTESRWNEKNTLILTFSKFSVSEDLKGESGGWITVMTVGGTVNGVTQNVAGTPQFAADEEVVLFLESSKSSQWQPVGLSQGRFRILRESRTGQQEVVHDLSGLELYDTSTRAASGPQKPYRMPLESFLGRVRNLIQTQK